MDLKSSKSLHSLFLFDADYPDPTTNKLTNYLLWSRQNLIPGVSYCLELEKASGNQGLDFIPPHPARGTGVHRIILALIEHPSSITKHSNERLFTFSKLLNDVPEARVCGTSFFRTCWTKQINTIYMNFLLKDEPLYGNFKRFRTSTSYKYMAA